MQNFKNSDYLKDKTVGVWGKGKTAISVLRFLKKLSVETYLIDGQDPKDWDNKDLLSDLCKSDHFLSEKMAFKKVSEFDVIVKSPGIPRTNKFYIEFRRCLPLEGWHFT